MQDVSGVSLAVMKMVHDYENYGRTNFSVIKLHEFGEKVVNLLNKSRKGDYRLWHLGVTAKHLDDFCDIDLYYDDWENDSGINIAHHGDISLKKGLDINKARRFYLCGLPADALGAAYDVLAKERKEYDEKYRVKKPNAKKM